MPAPRPALRADLPRVGETVWVVSSLSRTGREPNCMARASDLASASVMLPPLMVPWPSKEVKLVCVGWISGADCTTPSSSIPSSRWKFSSATLSHSSDPAGPFSV